MCRPASRWPLAGAAVSCSFFKLIICCSRASGLVADVAFRNQCQPPPMPQGHGMQCQCECVYGLCWCCTLLPAALFRVSKLVGCPGRQLPLQLVWAD